MPKVFVSHSSKDREFLERHVIPCLTEHRIDYWYSQRDLKGGDDWDRVIQTQLRDCDWFLVALSPDALGSPYVKDEVHWAVEHRASQNRLIPVQIADCDGDGFLGTRSLQWIDLRSPSESALRTLIDRFRAEQARNEIRDIESQSPARWVTEQDQQKAADLATQAAESLRHDLPVVALATLAQSLRLHQGSARSRYLLGITRLILQDDLREAVAELTRATSLNFDYAGAHFALAQVYQRIGAPRRAFESIGAAFAAEPGNQRYQVLRDEWREEGPPEGDDAINYDVEPAVRAELSRAASDWQKEEAPALVFRHWTARFFPWRWIAHRPLAGSIGLAALVWGACLMSHIPSGTLTADRVAQQSVIWSLCWVGLYYPFLLCRVVSGAFHQLRPAIRLDDDDYRQFFSRQSIAFLGVPPFDARNLDRRSGDSRLGRWHLGIAAVMFVIQSALSYHCAHDFPAPSPTSAAVLPFALRYLSYFAQAYLVCWLMPTALLGLAFVPRFIHVPQRFYLGMPETFSLRAIGTLYLRIAAFSSLAFLMFMMQHHVFHTAVEAPWASTMYFAFFMFAFASVMLVSQCLIWRAHSRLKERLVTRQSHNVESAFQSALASPTAENLAGLDMQRRFMSELSRIDTWGLTVPDRWKLLLLVLFVLSVCGTFWYLDYLGAWLV